MKYFHRTSVHPDEVLAAARRFFRPTLALVEEHSRRLQFAGPIGRIGIAARADGGHYIVVTAETDQVGESEADKLAKRFLTTVHTMAEPRHRPIGAY
ncbi:MAG TPA: hypothetical protein VFU40_02400 [Gemmatimonadales bacterium]|nr:hypothetical protein [Gemmatimonadales bacterium]